MGTRNDLENKSHDMVLLQLLDEVDCDLHSSLDLYHQPPKSADQAAAKRLAKRLYYLDGFTITDASKHLVKKEEFSQYVAEEYLKFYQFTGMTLDKALREFLSKVILYGDSYDQERVLQYFSRRYYQCNPTAYPDSDACHYLTTALVALSCELHEQNPVRLFTAEDFIQYINAVEGYSNIFSHEELTDLYHSVRNKPLVCTNPPNRNSVISQNGMPLSTIGFGSTAIESFLNMPEEQEFLRGFIIRKCVVDNNGKKIRKPRRGWKEFYGRIKGLYLYLYRTEDFHVFEKAFSQLASSISFHEEDGSSQWSYMNMIPETRSTSSRFGSNETIYTLPEAEYCLPLHHSSTWIDLSYVKRPNTFRLRLYNGAEFYLRTYGNVEMHQWLNIITRVAAVLSPANFVTKVTSSEEVLLPHYSLVCTDSLDWHQRLDQYAKQLSFLVTEATSIESKLTLKTLKPRQRKQMQQRQCHLKNEIERLQRYMEAINSILNNLEYSFASTYVNQGIHGEMLERSRYSNNKSRVSDGSAKYSHYSISPSVLSLSLQEEQHGIELKEADYPANIEC